MPKRKVGSFTAKVSHLRINAKTDPASKQLHASLQKSADPHKRQSNWRLPVFAVFTAAGLILGFYFKSSADLDVSIPPQRPLAVQAYVDDFTANVKLWARVRTGNLYVRSDEQKRRAKAEGLKIEPTLEVRANVTPGQVADNVHW